MDDHRQFLDTGAREIAAQGADPALAAATQAWMVQAEKHRYSYHFEWLGRPIIQHPQDIVAVQQLIWQVRPDLIVETGIARGGSLILSASLLELVALCGGPADAQVLGIDLEIRDHNRAAIEAHPMAHRIAMLEGSSTAPDIVAEVRRRAAAARRVLVFLDSNHTHDHVLAELEAYAPLVSPGSWCVVFDTVIATMPEGAYADRPWSRVANPLTAVQAFLARCAAGEVAAPDGAPLDFVQEREMEDRLLITVAAGGFLRRRA